MNVLLVTNYSPDSQQSMLRFGRMLPDLLEARGCRVAVARPPAILGRYLPARMGEGRARWLGYADKYLLFPGRLRRTIRREAGRSPLVVHVADHSNALYLPATGPVPFVVTCHDLLAVRGARGEDTDCPASRLGRLLQSRIVRGLSRAAAVASVSRSTAEDLDRLVPAKVGQLRLVIPMGLNHPYRRLEPGLARRRLAGVPGVPLDRPFLVHVGSDLPRKNRAGVVRVLGRLRDRWPGAVLFCGAPLTGELRTAARSAGVEERIGALSAPADSELEAVYSLAHALVFPSRAEGFGWPVIEAQSCGCPVICSDRTSLPEVGGEGALVHRLDDEAGMAESALRLDDPGFRAEVVRRGLANAARFDSGRMADEYCRLYAALLPAP